MEVRLRFVVRFWGSLPVLVGWGALFVKDLLYCFEGFFES